MRCIECNTTMTEGTAVCPKCGKPVEDRYLGFTMAWYKFMINFALWFSALITFIRGFNFMMGTPLGDNREALFQAFPRMEPGCVVLGLLMMGMAVLAIAAAVLLRGLRKAGPILLYCQYIGSIVVVFATMLLFVWGTEGLLGLTDTLNGSDVALILLDLVMLVLNIIYFRKRKVLFH